MARYKQLREQLEQEIASGVYRVGDKFPTDFELRERFGVSRHTVREALRALQEQGILERQPGSGTVIRSVLSRDVYAQTANSLDELTQFAHDARFEIREEGWVRARAGMAEVLDVEPDGRWLRIAGVRVFHEKGPSSWSEIYIAEAYADVRDDVHNKSGPVYSHIARRFGVQVAEVEQRVSAVGAPQKAAAALNIEPGAPSLLVRRRYFDAAEKPFEVSLTLHPGDRYVYTARLSRGRRGVKSDV